MSEMLLRGLEGANPLGFLAAVGTLRQCSLLWKTAQVRMRWIREGGWRPLLAGIPVDTEAELCRSLAEGTTWAPLTDFAELGNNLTVSQEVFERVARKIAGDAMPGERTSLDFVSAFGNEVFEDKDKGRIEYTDLSFITGSGHQHFLGTARALQACAGEEHLSEALFGPWRFQDKGNSLRWDPEDAKEYALRWRDPSVGGVLTVWGANRLAFEALPLFPMVPDSRGLKTTGFRFAERAHEFTWPIWTQPASVDTVRSLLSLRELQEANPNKPQFEAMGIGEVFRTQRVRIGQGANFKVSFRPARAV
jgi:hypothetical protein